MWILNKGFLTDSEIKKSYACGRNIVKDMNEDLWGYVVDYERK